MAHATAETPVAPSVPIPAITVRDLTMAFGDFVLQHYFDQQPELETERSLSFVQQLIESAKMEAA